MWSGEIYIGNTKTYVEVYETKDLQGMKIWKGYGKVLKSKDAIIGEHETSIGVLIVETHDIFTGDFRFIGSGKPYINL